MHVIVSCERYGRSTPSLPLRPPPLHRDEYHKNGSGATGNYFIYYTCKRFRSSRRGVMTSLDNAKLLETLGSTARAPLENSLKSHRILCAVSPPRLRPIIPTLSNYDGLSRCLIYEERPPPSLLKSAVIPLYSSFPFIRLCAPTFI